VVKILLPPLQVGCLASLYIDQFKQEKATAGSASDDESNAETAVLSLPNAEKESDSGTNEAESKADESDTPDMKTSEEKTRKGSEEKEDGQEKN